MPSDPASKSGKPTKFDRFRVESVSFGVSGKIYTRDVIRHPGSVVVVPLLPDERVCLIRNFRPSVDRSLIELPAGTLDPGE
ncbi:MAG: NUDIX hydrolase, partial [Planctomycetota bacterium]|nr:NUDIX hydrolase [Planctomycetota bacterium]